MQQPPAVAAGPAYMRVGVEGAPRCGRGTRSITGHGAGMSPHVKQAQQAWARATVWAQDIKQRGPRGKRGTPHEVGATGAGVWTQAPFGRPGARCSDI